MCTVKDTPGINYNHVILEKPVRGRYARFCSSAEGYAEVAEMHFYKGEEEIVPIDSWGDAPATVGTLPIRSMIMSRCRISFHQNPVQV
mgnify:CR=1 FL=1